jgi:hypothetical protein
MKNNINPNMSGRKRQTDRPVVSTESIETKYTPDESGERKNTRRQTDRPVVSTKSIETKVTPEAIYLSDPELIKLHNEIIMKSWELNHDTLISRCLPSKFIFKDAEGLEYIEPKINIGTSIYADNEPYSSKTKYVSDTCGLPFAIDTTGYYTNYGTPVTIRLGDILESNPNAQLFKIQGSDIKAIFIKTEPDYKFFVQRLDNDTLSNGKIEN